MKTLSEHIQESFKENKEEVQQTVVENQKNEETVLENTPDENKDADTIENKTFLSSVVGTASKK